MIQKDIYDLNPTAAWCKVMNVIKLGTKHLRLILVRRKTHEH